MGERRKERRLNAIAHFRSEQAFALNQRINELAQSIRHWPDAAMTALRLKEMEDLEEKLAKLETKDD